MSITPMQKLITQRTDRNGFCGEKVTTTFTVRCWAESTDKINKATKERYKKILISDVKDVVLQECGFTLGHFEAMQAAINDYCEESKFGAENWKTQPHIKALFDLRSGK